ncbi:MAG: TonB family protein [Algoriphagus sp.]|jgi:TonB family protein
MNQLLIYLLEASICLAICLLFYRLLLSELTFFNLNRAVLLGMLLISAVFPLLSYPLVQVSQATLDFTLPEFIVGQGVANQVQSISWIEIGLYIYGAGVIAMTVHLMFGFLMSQRLIGKSKLFKHQNLWIAVHPDFIPASFFEYILLPEFDPNQPETKQIILHESMHVRLYHSWDLLLIQLAKIIFWFNPLVYQFEKSLREVHEYQADQGVTNTYSKKEYSGLLLQLITKGHGWQFMNNFNQFQTKKRIIMMSKPKSENREKSKFIFALPLVALLFVVFSCEITPEPEIEGPTQMGEKAQQLGPTNLTARINEGADQIFDVVENQPNPPGGMSGWNQYLAQSIQYPAEARRMGIEGTVILVFVVGTDGSLSDVEILRGIGGGADEESIRVVQNSPNWEAGTQGGRAVKTRMRLPIRFKLDNESKVEINPAFDEMIEIPIKN